MPQAGQSQQSEKSKTSKRAARQTAPQARGPAPLAPLSLPLALADPLSASPAQVLQLQRQYGNRAVQRLIQRAQAEKIQREAAFGLDGGAAAKGGEISGDLQNEIDSARGGGQPLDRTVGSQIGGALGADLSGVQVHTDSHSDALNRSLSAQAFTTGSDIFFSEGEYNPGTHSGKELLAHELTHVVQQGSARPNNVQTKLAVGPANDRYEDEAEAVAGQVMRTPEMSPPFAEQAGQHVQPQMAAPGVVQRKGGKVTGPHSGGINLKKDDVIDYDEAGVGFRKKITINSLNGKSFPKPVVIDGLAAINLRKLLEDYDGPLVVEDGPSEKQGKLTDEARLENLREKSVVKGSGNPDLEGGIENSFFTKPKPISIDKKTGDITVEMMLRTYNIWDRVTWYCRVGSKENYVLVPEDKSWWSNPGWDRLKMYKGYTFRQGSDFSQLGPEGKGGGGTSREIRTTVPGKYVKQIFGEDLSGLNKSSIICIGMEVFYGGSGPSTATREEFGLVYDANVKTAHNYGHGATSTPESYGYVDLSGTDLPEGQWLTDEEVWNEDIDDNPSPNIKLPMPEGYDNAKLIEPLQPKEGMQIATRIENEATLKVSSLEKLRDIISYLTHLSENSEDVSAIMRGDETLAKFTWSIKADTNSDIFSDIYLDDLKHTALRAGVGIRKRWTPKATKLNVKTGPGYQVGELDKDNQESSTVKSDIYRRHEIGYDLNPEAKISDISEFLSAGVEKYDPWNRGGEQVNQALPEGEKIDFKQLQGTMVLKGDRRKFNLKAVHKESGGAINIEISCDHTVGRTFEDYQKVQELPDLFDLNTKYAQVFNVEIELEHLGAGAQKKEESKKESETDTPKTTTTGDTGSQSQEPPSKSKAPKKRPRPGHPGRLYMRDDTANPKFNTQSFEVFAKAHSRMIRALQVQLKDSTELGEDKQKLETLFAQLFPDEKQTYGSPIERGAKKPSSDLPSSDLTNLPPRKSPTKRVKEVAPDHNLINVDGTGLNCSIRALMLSSGEEIDESDVALYRRTLVDRQLTQPGSFLGLGHEEDEAQPLFELMRDKYLKGRPVTVLYDHQAQLDEQQVLPGGGQPIYVYLRGYHYQAVVPQ